MPTRITICACVTWLVFAAAARAQPRDPMAAGLAAYESLEYERAVELLEQALASAERNEDKVAIVRALAFSHVALEQPELARAELQLWLRLDPAATLDRTISPRVRTLFDEARAGLAGSARELAPVAALAPPRPRAGQAIALTLMAFGRTRAQLFYRTRGRAPFSLVAADGRDGRFELTVPGLDVAAPAFEYYLVVLDGNGAPAGGLGAPDQPLSVSVEALPARRKPVYKRAWFWVTLAGVATAAVVAGAVAGSLLAPSSTRVIIAHP